DPADVHRRGAAVAERRGHLRLLPARAPHTGHERGGRPIHGRPADVDRRQLLLPRRSHSRLLSLGQPRRWPGTASYPGGIMARTFKAAGMSRRLIGLLVLAALLVTPASALAQASGVPTPVNSAASQSTAPASPGQTQATSPSPAQAPGAAQSAS